MTLTLTYNRDPLPGKLGYTREEIEVKGQSVQK